MALTTPYILTNATRADWTAYLKKSVLGAADHPERFLVELQGDPVNLPGGAHFQAAQETIIVVVMIPGVLLPIGDECFVGLVWRGHGGECEWSVGSEDGR